MLDLIAAAGIGGIIGFGTCAFLTMGKLADISEAARAFQDEAATQKAIAKLNGEASRLNAGKLSAIRDLLDKPRTIRKGELAMILDGEVA